MYVAYFTRLQYSTSANMFQAPVITREWRDLWSAWQWADLKAPPFCAARACSRHSSFSLLGRS